MNWDQPMCNRCWGSLHPDREPVRVRKTRLEVCAWCGAVTRSGIYVRAHPDTVSHPKEDDGE
jgi:hypothetical protein